MSLHRGRIVVAQSCSTLSLHRLVAPTKNDGVENTVKFGEFALKKKQNTPIRIKFDVSVDVGCRYTLQR